MTFRLPLSGTPTTLKMMSSITSDMRNMMTVTGSIFPVRAAPTEPFAVSIHSRAVACLSSVPMVKTVTMTTKMSSIMGIKLGER